MKCPACELSIEDEGLQVQHIERCHPGMLAERWTAAGMSKEDQLGQMLSIREKYPPLDAILDRCQQLQSVNIHMLKGRRIHVVLQKGDQVAESWNTTLYSAICLAMDRLEYR